MNPGISEPAFNVALGSLLETKHPRWCGCVGIEQTGVLREGAGLKPDIVIRHPGGLPVIMETEYSPAQTVEEDARARLGRRLRGDSRPIEQSIALRIPKSLAAVNQHNLKPSIGATRMEFCVFSGSPVKIPPLAGTVLDTGRYRRPGGLCRVGGLSEDQMAKGPVMLELYISQAANLFHDYSLTRTGLPKMIADKLGS